MSTLDDDGIRAEFDTAARRYDLMVALNPGYHRHLRAAARALASALGAAPSRLLDLGCGSGASTRALGAVFGDVEVIGVDASAGMLAQAQRKRWPTSTRFVHSAAGALDPAVVGAPLDGVLAAYLFRNVAAADRDRVLADVRALLRPGGVLAAEEYSVAGNRLATIIWTLVCWTVVVPLSVITTRRTKLYRYLWRSVIDFDSIERFAQRLRDAGFVDVRSHTVGGWQRGILHVVTARNPADSRP